MKKIIITTFILGLSCLNSSFAFALDTNDKEAFKKMLTEVLNENPEILFDVIKKIMLNLFQQLQMHQKL